MLAPSPQPALAAFFSHTGLWLITTTVQESQFLLESTQLPLAEGEFQQEQIFQVPELTWLCQLLCRRPCFVFRDKMQTTTTTKGIFKQKHLLPTGPQKSPGLFPSQEAATHYQGQPRKERLKTD